MNVYQSSRPRLQTDSNPESKLRTYAENGINLMGQRKRMSDNHNYWWFCKRHFSSLRASLNNTYQLVSLKVVAKVCRFHRPENLSITHLWITSNSIRSGRTKSGQTPFLGRKFTKFVKTIVIGRTKSNLHRVCAAIQLGPRLQRDQSMLRDQLLLSG